MINIGVKTNSAKVSKDVRKISTSVQQWCKFAVGKEADIFRDYVKSNWLQGKALKYRTGITHDHVKVWSKGYTVYVRPGIGIQGTQNYLAKWIGTKHEFMRPAFKEFSSSGRIEKAVKENLDKMMEIVCEE